MIYFKDTSEVVVPRAASFRNVEFLRNGTYIPVLITPILENDYILKYQFLQPETGRIF